MHTLFQIINFIGLQGLYYFSKLNNIPLFKITTQNETLLSEICVFYLLFVICILGPYIFFKFNNKKPIIKIRLLKKQFNYFKVIRYLIFSQILLCILLILIFLFTKMNPIYALQNCLEFRYAYTHGVANYVFIFFKIILVFNLILLLKLILIDKINRIIVHFISIIFFSFYIFWFLISGSRGFLLMILIYSIYIIFLNNKLKIKFRNLIIGIIMSIIVISVLAAYYTYRNIVNDISKGNVIAQQVSIEHLIENTDIITTTIERNDAFSNSVRYLVHVNKENCSIFFNMDTHITKSYIYPIINLVPRSILPNKGHFTHEILTAKIFPNLVFENVTMIFGGFANLYYTGNLPYVIFDALLFGFFIAILQFSYKYYINYDFFFINYVYIILNLITHYFGIGLLSTHDTIPFIIQTIMSILISILLSNNKLLERKGY